MPEETPFETQTPEEANPDGFPLKTWLKIEFSGEPKGSRSEFKVTQMIDDSPGPFTFYGEDELYDRRWFGHAIEMLRTNEASAKRYRIEIETE